ncbi:uncharacterized protein HMPREF1541_07362 [Cyphellophora europaea CBS 101466]|uniref:CFEM domain-containing protein n=1 Tax=Cyphellophora europaea (strain CBS 101466) TaxID=1220924 RepID=W2RPT1_CYPE1|nr:uncharacterized protein HMPREF1541_07362 [Cyphellophora europaea CBS 101466]ETN37739.1 hypothetical protein HMPREF1541_07362 [Cyphellophora europaea CBS 101466]
MSVDLSGITIQQVPQCAQNCLANSTQAQTSCQVIDIACLCSNSAYVSTLSCCLATTCNPQEQSLAIQFNQDECSKVNKTAPAFVGCSPLNLTSVGGSQASTQTTLSTQTSSGTSLVSTVTGSIVTEPPSFSGATVTASFGGAPLLTGTCSNPYFALVTNAAGTTIQYPAVGCGPHQQSCCPYSFGSNARISRCPQDYFTTSGGCCPIGYQVYYTGIGAQTPCYSIPSTPLVPATTRTDTARFSLVSQTIFAQKFELAGQAGGDGLSTGALIGVIAGPVVFSLLVINFVIFFMLRRRKVRRIREAERATTYPPFEPIMPQNEVPQTPHELASPDVARSPRSPQMGQIGWVTSPGSSPPAYDSQRNLNLIGPAKLQIPQDPQELEGSTFIHQHHPAFTGEPTSASATDISPKFERPKTPKTPIRSPQGSDRNSPLITPSSGKGPLPRSPPAVSPPNSPRQVAGRLE